MDSTVLSITIIRTSIVGLALGMAAGCHYHTVHVTYTVPQGPGASGGSCVAGNIDYVGQDGFSGTAWEGFASCGARAVYHREERDSKLSFFPFLRRCCQGAVACQPVGWVQPVTDSSPTEHRPLPAPHDSQPTRETAASAPIYSILEEPPTPKRLTPADDEPGLKAPPKNLIPSTVK